MTWIQERYAVTVHDAFGGKVLLVRQSPGGHRTSGGAFIGLPKCAHFNTIVTPLLNLQM